MRVFKPCVAAISGLPLHGKTDVAFYMAKHANFALRDVDDFRREHFPAQSGIALPEAEEIDVMVRSFRYMMDSVGRALANSQPVVLPSTFSRRVFKDALLRFVGENPDTPSRIFRLEIDSEDIVRAHLAKRLRDGTNSNVKSMERYHWSKTIVEPWPDDTSVIPINAERSVEEVANDVFTRLRDLEL